MFKYLSCNNLLWICRQKTCLDNEARIRLSLYYQFFINLRPLSYLQLIKPWAISRLLNIGSFQAIFAQYLDGIQLGLSELKARMLTTRLPSYSCFINTEQFDSHRYVSRLCHNYVKCLYSEFGTNYIFRFCISI